MPDGEHAEVCELCQQGTLVTRDEEMSFYQWTDRGYVFCKVTIPMKICAQCGMKTWDEAAEAVIEEAVRQARDRLR
jgi:hypothetical protein